MEEITLRGTRAQRNLMEWSQRVADCRSSGLSVARWCSEHNVKPKTYYNWQKMVQQEFELDPFTNTLFLFCGRRRDRIKGLYWEGDGFILLYKRLERGVYQWPRNEQEAKEITPQQYRWLMEGLKVEQPKAHRPVTGLTAI